MRKAQTIGLRLGAGIGSRMTPSLMERVIARGYGLTYQGIVTGFEPYEKLLDDVAALVRRAQGPDAAGPLPPAAAVSLPPAAAVPLRVLDVSCGIGTVALRLAREGHAVVGLDAVGHLIAVAREKSAADGRTPVTFYHRDVTEGLIPGAGAYDVVVSMHTLYWHHDPDAVLAACRRALKPGGHGVFLTYARPAHVATIFREIRRTEGVAPAARALRWLVPTALFERFRDCEHRYFDERQFHQRLAGAGFDVIESRRTFLAGMSVMAWTRRRDGADAL